MKYFLLNKKEVKNDIWTNPILVRTKSLSKIKKIRTLQKKLDTLVKQVTKELKESNNVSSSTQEIIDQLFLGENLTEVTSKEYNALKVMCLYDNQLQRIQACNKTEVLKGKLYGDQIK